MRMVAKRRKMSSGFPWLTCAFGMGRVIAYLEKEKPDLCKRPPSPSSDSGSPFWFFLLASWEVEF
jgi:hypothetical protein